MTYRGFRLTIHVDRWRRFRRQPAYLARARERSAPNDELQAWGVSRAGALFHIRAAIDRRLDERAPSDPARG